jgi:hypothetical protein
VEERVDRANLGFRFGMHVVRPDADIRNIYLEQIFYWMCYPMEMSSFSTATAERGLYGSIPEYHARIGMLSMNQELFLPH